MENVPRLMLSYIRVPEKKLSACICGSKKCTKGTTHSPYVQESVLLQARVSGDYHPGHDQWRIGVSSMLAAAIGLRPFKDTFWTTTNQPGNKYSRSQPSIDGLEAVREINLKILFQKIIPCNFNNKEICDNRVKQRIDAQAVLNYCIN